MSAASTTEQSRRAPPGGATSIMLGSADATWETTTNAHGEFADGARTVATDEPRKPPGGVDSVQLGGYIAPAAVEELLARPSVGGADSIEFGKEGPAGLTAEELRARSAPGGADSIDFSKVPKGAPCEELLARPWPGGSATVVLGGDNPGWTTDSQALGVGSAEAAAAVEATVRPAPGGVDSIDFNAKQKNLTAEEHLARPSPGGADSVDFGASEKSTLTADALLARPQVGGSATVVLGGDSSEWTTNSQVHGVGSVEAVAAQEAVARPAPGGPDSIKFGAKVETPSADALLARPKVGGETEIKLGADKGDWTTNSSSLGVGSVEAIEEAEPRARPPPGGVDSVTSINTAVASASAQELLQRPATGGKATVVLGGDSTEWATSSGEHGTISLVDMASVGPIERPAPGGVDSIVLGAADKSTLTAEDLRARPSPGGKDSVNFTPGRASTLKAEDLILRPSPGGSVNVVLGSDAGAWATSSSVYNGTPVLRTPGSARPPPGGEATFVMGAVPELPSLNDLRARPTPGGNSTVVLGGDDATWVTNSSATGVGCSDAVAKAPPATNARMSPAAADSIDFSKTVEQTPARPMRVMTPAMSPSSIKLEDNSFCPEPGVSSNRFANGSNPNAGNTITDRSSTRLHQAPGGNSSINLSDGTVAEPTVSANRFACGSSQNQGNVLTDRSTTRLHQAPGGNSSINLSDDGKVPEIGVSSNRFANGSNPNAANGITDRSSTKVRCAPGGKSTLVLGAQDENVNSSNIERATDVQAKASDVIVEGASQTAVLG